MNDAQLLRLPLPELLKALDDKDVISHLRKEPSILSQLLEMLDEKDVARIFVKNKFAPKEVVIKWPLAFIKEFLDQSFNPGTDGLIDLCTISTSPKVDKGISKLVSQFTTNKYDASFIKGLMNLSSGGGIVLTETISTLLQDSSVSLILLNDLKDKNPEEFVRILAKLKGDLRKQGVDLLTYDLITEVKDEETAIPLLKLIMEFKQDELLYKVRLGDYNQYSLSRVTEEKRLHSKLSDEELVYFLNNVSPDSSFKSKIPYRTAFEEIDAGQSRLISALVKDIPQDSKFFLSSFIAGNNDLPAQDAYDLLSLSNAYSLNKELLLFAVLHRSGSDTEMASVISANSEPLVSFIESCSIKPAGLRDAIGHRRPGVAKVICSLFGADYRKQIHSHYPDLRKDGGASISEKHHEICVLFERGEGRGGGPEFLEKIASYDSNENSIEGNLQSFITRHKQVTYKKKYERLHLRHSFLKSLKNEDIAMALINKSNIPFQGYYDRDKNDEYLSAKNALKILKDDKEDVTTLYQLTYEKDKFLDSLSPKELVEIDFYDDEKNGEREASEQIAKLLVRKANAGGKLEVKSKKILFNVASLLSKSEFTATFNADLLEYHGYYKLTFKGGERYSAKDILTAAKDSGKYGFGSVLDALEEIGAKEELRAVCLAILSPKATDFNRMFPKAGNRDANLRQKANKILSTLNPEEVNVKSILKKETSLASLQKSLGDQMVDLLMKVEAERGRELPTLWVNTDIKKSDLETLKTKYTLAARGIEIEKASDLRLLRDLIALDIRIEYVSVKNQFGTYWNKKKPNLKLVQETIELASQTSLVDEIYAGDHIFDVAKIENCAHILSRYELSSIQEKVKNLEDLKNAHELDLPMSDSKPIATKVANNVKMLKFAIENSIRFNDLVIEVSDYALSSVFPDDRELASLFPEAAKIGLTIVTSSEARCLHVWSRIFEQNGSIKDFEPISLAGLDLSGRIELIKLLASKNPKYKKLLSQDLSSNEFVLNPPQLLDKSLVTINNMKDIFGFGIPGNLSKEQKDQLSDVIVARGPVLGIAVQNTKKLFGLAGLNHLQFEDFFNRQNESFDLSQFALFMGTEYEPIDESAEILFSTVMKSPSRAEVISLLRDSRHNEFHTSFLKDAVYAFSQARENINKFVAILDEPNISAGLIFNAMAGDNAANGVLDERMQQEGDDAEMLKLLSNSVKEITVRISIARKQVKAGDDSVSLAVTIHNLLGELSRATRYLVSEKDAAKALKQRTGFEKFNDSLIDVIGSKKNQKRYSIYFPMTRAEVQDVGAAHSWCTRYNQSYFDETLGGNAILFNIKESDKIVAQGYVRVSGKKFVMNQIRYNNNVDAQNDFDSDEIILKLRDLILQDSNLRERYML